MSEEVEKQETGESKPSTKRFLLEIVITVVFIIGLAALLRTFVFQAYNIPSGSMEDTIATGDMVFTEKITYYGSSPKQGDIVTFNDPSGQERTLIKRVIAVAGQTVDLEAGYVVVDGEVLDEPYTDGKVSQPLSSTIEYPYTVPEGCIWVMGDNRTNSSDSRVFGAVKVSEVTGKAVLIYWPFEHFGLLQ